MGSELGQVGKRAMKGLANMLGIIDVKQAPGLLKTDELVPVIAADAGWAGYEPLFLTQFGNFNVSESVIEIYFTGDPGALLPDNAGDEVIILGWNIRVNFNAVAAAAQAGKYLNCDIYYYPPNNFMTIGNFRRIYQVSVADPVLAVGPETFVSPASGGAGSMTFMRTPFWIPAGVGASASIYFDDGSSFLSGGGSAGWSFEAYGVKVPKGVKPPSVP